MFEGKGRSFEEALAYWSDSASYLAYLDDGAGRIISPAEMFYRERGVDLWQRYVDQSRRALEAQLFRRLAEGSLLSSATDEVPDLRTPRFLVHPSHYDVAPVTYDHHRRVVLIGQRTLWNIEIFESHEVPRSISEIPDWLSRYSNHHAGAGPSGKDAAAPLADFRHDRDYRHVTLRGREFALTATQGSIVKALHQAPIESDGWMHVEELRDKAGFQTAKISQLFRSRKDWRELIRSNGKGCYRLNL